ncbi:MAG TPA: ABC transporter permease [Vicinamibacterales bacterium]|nr:ABC transporter permease [Vicinamibacterales bacterium]
MSVLQDFRHAVRAIRQTPGFSAVVTLTVALGDGATTAMWSVVDAVLVRPLPYPARQSLVKLFDSNNGRDVGSLSFPEFVDWRDRARDIFESIGAYGPQGEVLSGTGQAELLFGVQASLDIPSLLGLRPILGRGFVDTDEAPNGPNVVILGEHVWRGRFSADPGIIGRVVTLTGVPHQVIGVFPSDASAIPPSPYFMVRGKPADFWEPLQRDAATAPRGLHQLDVIARLQSAVAPDRAAVRLDAIANEIKKDRSTTHGLHVRPLATVLVGDFTAPLALLLSAVALLLLIACGNVANLLLARSASREREFAIRTALGADRRTLASLVIVESVTRAAIGGLFGVGFAYGVVMVARTLLVGTIPRVSAAAIDGRALTVACGLTLLSGFLFGVVPALRAPRGSVRYPARDAVRRTLMVGEIALSFVLLVSAALLADSYLRLVNVPKGFNPDGLMTARVWLPSTRYASEAAQTAFFDRLTERLAADFQSGEVTMASDLPVEGGTYGSVGLTNPRFPDGAAHVEHRIVAPNYFGVLQARLVRGRFLQSSDAPGSQPVVVVNETFARRWLEGDPIGQTVAFSWGITGTQAIVGVVADVREGGLDEQPGAAVYIPRAQRPSPDMHIIVRTSRAASEVARLIRASVAGLDAALPVLDMRSGDDIIAAGARPQELTGGVIGAFALSALGLAAIGLYGLISYSVAQRRHELGVRAAIGARPVDLMRLVLGQSVRVTAIGIVWGAGAALAVSRVLSVQLFGVGARDPRVYAASALVIAVVSLVASALPTLRATRANPIDALRSC